MIRFKQDVLKQLKERGYTQPEIIRNGWISAQTMTYIRKGDARMSMIALSAICCMLRCQPGDILENVPTDEEKIKYF